MGVCETVRLKQVCYLQVVHGLVVRLDKSVVKRPKGELATLTLMLNQGRNKGVNAGIYRSFQS